jgi:hypothetical protein
MLMTLRVSIYTQADLVVQDTATCLPPVRGQRGRSPNPAPHGPAALPPTPALPRPLSSGSCPDDNKR